MTAPVDELEPVRAELLRAARAEADSAARRARADAAETLRAARADAERVLAQARELGAGDGRVAADRERVRAAEEAWSRELAAGAEVYADLRAGVRAGVRRALADGAARPGRCGETVPTGRERGDLTEAGAGLEAGARSCARPALPENTGPDRPHTRTDADLAARTRSCARPTPPEDTGPKDRLAETARALLGAEARITVVAGGGITADVPGRHLDLSADVLADRALERMGARIASLWSGP
ncbi:hypothetical protein [Streptomyces sp. NPDC048663]|uniref:hypothetical protein n=1 Tax=Streptomyces sp. NPDC048663 TaxID=3155638 RepID=UPI00343FCFA5